MKYDSDHFFCECKHTIKEDLATEAEITNPCYRSQLEGTLGIKTEAETRPELSIDRNSDPSLDTKVKDTTKDLKELNEEKRRSARRKE